LTVLRHGNGTITLEGDCSVEDAEALLQMLLATPAARVDWTQAGHLHTAVVQVMVAAKPTLAGPCGDSWVRQWIPVESWRS
jgi:hypothetical protein